MKLVEAEAEGPVEGDDPLITPPPPPHRRVSVSLLLTLSVLVGLVVAIYVVFPARHNVLATVALEQHRGPQAWDITAPSAKELRSYTIGVVGGKDPPLPSLPAIGARRIDILERHMALIRFKIGKDEVTYIVGHAARISPEHSELRDRDLRADAWVHGPFVCAGVGPEATAPTWLKALGGP